MSSQPSLFDPGRVDVDTLRRTTVERGRLLERLRAQIEDSVASGARHYKLLIGPYGIGKSHVLALLCGSLRDAPGLAGQLVTARLGGRRPEEPGQ